MTSIAQAVADLVSAPVPVLFLDTCALLDIVRAAARSPSSDLVRSARDIRANITTARQVRLCVQDLVPKEWDDNLGAARKDADGAIRAFEAVWELGALLNENAVPVPVLPRPTLTDDLVQLSRDLLDGATVLDREPDAMSWALDRVAQKKKPFDPKKGGAVKDCHIVAHAISMSTGLQQAGFSPTRLFVSPNTKDFATAAGAIHPDLAAAFAAAGLGYAISLSQAASLLRGLGELPT